MALVVQRSLTEPPPLPDNADYVTRMKHRLKTKEGREVYARRKITSEPVFGIIKAVMGFRSFLLRGYEAVKGEWNLVCLYGLQHQKAACFAQID